MTYEDEAVLFPVADLYDQGAMRMYIEAAKDLYDRGQKAIDDFIAKYGDFTSPILADVEYWDNNTMKPLIDMIDEFLRNGIDPARSREARNALMARARRLPYAQLAAIKLSAENAKLFNEAKRRLILEGKYNKAYAPYDGQDPSTFRTIGDDGSIDIFNRQSPTPVEDLTTFSNTFYKDFKPRTIKTSINGRIEEKEIATMDDLKDVARANINSILATPQGQLMYSAAYDMYEDENKAKEAIVDNIAASQVARLRNNIAKDDNYIDLEELNLKYQKQQTDLNDRLVIAGADANGDGIVDTDERKDYSKFMYESPKYQGRGGSLNVANIFREADTNAGNSFGVDYVRDTAYYLKIQPKISGISHTVNKDGSTYYTIPASEVGKLLYTHDSVYDTESNKLIRYNKFAQTSGNYYFRPTGTIKAKQIIDSKGRVQTRYFISGTLLHSDFDTDITDASGSPKIYEMEVVERKDNYGNKQKKN